MKRQRCAMCGRLCKTTATRTPEFLFRRVNDEEEWLCGRKECSKQYEADDLPLTRSAVPELDAKLHPGVAITEEMLTRAVKSAKLKDVQEEKGDK